MERTHFNLILFCMFGFISLVTSTSPSIVLYDGRNQTGNSVSVRIAYLPYLTQRDFDNKAESVCVNGTWLLYDNDFYNEKQLGVMEYVSGTSYCTNLKLTNKRVSSLRFVGSAVDIKSDSITIYSGTYYQGQEEYFTSYASYLSVVRNKTKSLIVTGFNGWRVFDEKHFQGHSFCVEVQTKGRAPFYFGKNVSFDPLAYFVPDIHEENPTFGNIQSLVQERCH